MSCITKGAKKRKVALAEIENDEMSESDKTALLADAIKHLTLEDAKQLTKTQVSVLLGVIEAASKSHGLSEEDLTALIGIIKNEDFHIKSRKRMISCLIPTQFVPEEAIIGAVCCITLKSLPITLQVALMRWINSMYNHLDNTEVLSHLYSVLFEFLRNESLCPDVCELLCKITKEEHVEACRIRRLITFKSRLGADPCLLTLLKVYADFKPDLLHLVTSKFKERKLRDTLMQIVPPENTTGDLENLTTKTTTSRQTMNEYDHLHEVVQNLKGRSGMLKLFISPMRRAMFTSNLSENILTTFRTFLQSGLLAEFTGRKAVCSSVLPVHSEEKLLPSLLELTMELQEAIPEALLFLASYLRTWDGQENSTVILSLLSRWEICKYDDLWETVLQPVHTLFYSSSIDFMCSVIQCLTDLYKYWVVFELPRFFQATGKDSTSVKKYTVTSIFCRDYGEFIPEEQVNALSIFIGNLCDISVLRYPHKPAKLLGCILRFYEMVLSMNSYNRSLLLLVPSRIIAASLLFSRSPFFVSEMCALICRYKDALYIMKREHMVTDLNAKVIPTVNKYIIDVSKMLALNAAFQPQNNSAFFQSSIPAWLKLSVYESNESVNICRHPALLGLGLHFRRKQDMELSHDALLKVTAVRNEYLRYLKSVNFSGIPVFLENIVNMKAL